MPATRSQKAALASPLDTTRKRSVSRALSAEPAPAPAPARRATTTTTTSKRKQVAVEAVEEDAQSPKKRARTLKDEVFHEKVQQRVAEKKAARAQQQLEQETEDPYMYAHAPAYPSPSQQPHTYIANTLPASQDDSESRYLWWKPPHQWQAPETPAQKTAPPQQVAQTQPQPARGFFGRLLDTLTPFKSPAQTPGPSTDTRLPDARMDLYQLKEHKKLQQQLNINLSQAIQREEQNKVAATPHHEYEEEQEQTEPGSKRKRFANEITGLAPLNVISESPEARFTDAMQTPSRATAKSYNGLVPKSLPKPRRTYKETRAAAAHKATRNATDPPTPAVSRTAPSTPYDKNDYERIRRMREIEQIRVQQIAMKEKLEKLRAEQEAEAEARPRKTKRVKIEHLKEIPHNLPGESSGSFRFPEFDSDDEIEVDEDAEEIENPFTTAHDEAPQQKQASPTKTPSSNPFVAQPSTTLFDKPALKAASPVKKAASPVTKAPSPVKKAPSPVKKAPTPMMKAPSPLREVTSAVEVEDEIVDAQDASPTASPEPTQIFSDASEDESDIDDEDWPELPLRKEGEPEPPQWWKDQASALFDKEFAHWEATGEIMA